MNLIGDHTDYNAGLALPMAVDLATEVRLVSSEGDRLLHLATTLSPEPLDIPVDAVALDPAQVSDTLGVLLKYQDDIAKIEGAKAQMLIDETRAEPRRLEIG